MALITGNDHHVLEMVLTMPLIGAWHARLELDTEDAIAGTVELACDDLALTGTVIGTATVVSGSCRLEIVGGAGGLRKDVTARSYQGVTARLVASDLLTAVGERLAIGSTAASLARSLQYWTRAQGAAGLALSRLVDALPDSRWRVLQDGSVWIGRESWPVAPDAALGEELDRSGAAGTVLIAPDAPALAPGVTINGERVGRVEHRVTREQSLRTTYWIEA